MCHFLYGVQDAENVFMLPKFFRKLQNEIWEINNVSNIFVFNKKIWHINK